MYLSAHECLHISINNKHKLPKTQPVLSKKAVCKMADSFFYLFERIQKIILRSNIWRKDSKYDLNPML